MTGGDTGGEEKKLLAWLVQCHRNHYLVPAQSLPPQLPEWAQGVGSAEFDISYEPRSLAVSMDGSHVAVGTKAGTIHLATWSNERRSWEPQELLRTGTWQTGGSEKPRARAIRALTFLDNSTLVAGWGAGNYRIFEGERVVNVPPTGFDAKPGGWMNRFSRLLPLFPGKTPEEGDLVLGLSVGSRVHVLSRDGGNYRVQSEDPLKGFLGWNSDWGRLVDGVWAQGHLWVLGSKGYVVRYTRDQVRGLLSSPSPHDLNIRGWRVSFRAIDGCELGLCFLASNYISFLRFEWSQNDGFPYVETENLRWEVVPDPLDCTVGFLFSPRAGEIRKWRKQPLAWISTDGNSPNTSR